MAVLTDSYLKRKQQLLGVTELKSVQKQGKLVSSYQANKAKVLQPTQQVEQTQTTPQFQPTPKVTFLDNLKSKVSNTFNTLKDGFPQTTQQIQSIKQKADIKKIPSETLESIKQPIANYINTMSKRLDKNAPKSSYVAQVADITSKTANVVLSPLNAIFTASNNVPILNKFTKLVSIPFALIGEAAQKDSDLLIDQLPISQQAKDELKPAIGEVSSLAAQIALGKVTATTTKKANSVFKKVTKDNFEKLTKDMIVESGSPKTIRLTPEEVRKINLGVGDKYQAEMVKELGFKSSEWAKAVKEGINIDIPAEKITRIIDKPYWERVKTFFGQKTTDKTIVEKGTPSTKTGFGGYLTEKVGKVNFEPKDIIDSVLTTEVVKTPEGQKAIKLAYQAEKNGTKLAISTEGKGDVVITTADGQKIGISEVKSTSKISEVPKTNLTAPSNLLISHEGAPDKITVSEYKTKIQNGEKIEPIKVIREGEKYGIEDGKHRYQAYKELGIKDIPIQIVEERKIKPKVVSVPREQIPVGEGEEKVSRLEKRVLETVNKIPQETIDKLGTTTYNEVSKKENIQKASNYVLDNPEEAIKVLNGDIEAPKGILRNSVYVAMENLAKGDVELARKLASISSTRMGQELSILTELDPNSPVKVMRDIIKIKEEAFKKRYGNKKPSEVKKKMAKEIKDKVKKPDKWDWNKFITDLQC